MDTASWVVTEEAHNVFPFGLVFNDQMFGLSIVAAGCLKEDREKHTGPVAWPDSMVTSYPLSLPSETLPLLPSPPACSFCDLRLLATSQRILPPFTETPPTSPFHSATLFASPNLRPHGLRTSASCPCLQLHYIFAPTLYPTSFAP